MDYKEQDIRETGGLSRAPFACTDARRPEAKRATTPGHPTIDQINVRLQSFIANMCGAMSSVSAKLEDHADILYGPYPVSDGPGGQLEQVKPCYGSGHFAFTQEALDDLERAFESHMKRLAQAAGRNTTLA